MIDDRQTAEYFDRFTPHFAPKRFNFALDFLQAHATEEQALIDVGCGDGATLAMVRDGSPIANLWGLDVAGACLKKAEAETGCSTIHGSILDPTIVSRYEEQFDYAILGAVLHHLIGRTRRASLDAATLCVAHTLRLLKRGGHLIIFEPTYEPRWAMWCAFWMKRIVGSMISSRLELGRSWLNVAQPVVSYYSVDQVRGMLRSHDVGQVVELLSGRTRLVWLIKYAGLCLILRRP